MRIVIPGDPVAQSRPRIFRRNGRITAVNTKGNEKLKVQKWIRFYQKLHKLEIDLKGAQFDHFEVEMIFYLQIPLSNSRASKVRKWWGLEAASGKPDLDNMEKFYLDCLSGICFSDDAKVTKLSSRKMYASEPKTIILIKGKKNMAIDEQAEGILTIFDPQILDEFLSMTKTIDTAWPKEEEYTHADHETICGIAKNISFLAEMYGPFLQKVAKKYPEYWKNASYTQKQE
jgi:Holliday junction resolvase RusA-like endonuclease